MEGTLRMAHHVVELHTLSTALASELRAAFLSRASHGRGVLRVRFPLLQRCPVLLARLRAPKLGVSLSLIHI